MTEGVSINVDEAGMAKRIARTPVGRLGQVEDIANAAVFLAGDDSGFMTGESMLIDGGVTHAFSELAPHPCIRSIRFSSRRRWPSSARRPDPERIGGRPLRFLVEAGFRHAVPVNRSGAAEIQGLPAFASLADVPGAVDHAIVAVPVPGVEAALQDCARKGVKVVQVFTAGFAEADAAGAELQARLVRICKEAGMRDGRPECVGLLNPSAKFYATFSTALNGLRPKPA